MPSNVLSNPLVLAILGILVEGPAHSYRLHLELKRRRLVADPKPSRGTHYNVIHAIERQGWIVGGTAERAGKRPEHITYSLTDGGVEELRRRLDQQIRVPVWSPDQLFHSVSHIGVLGRLRACDALGERSSHLKEEIKREAKAHRIALAAGVPRLFVLETEYVLHSRRAELRWIERTADEIETGELKWPNLKK